MLQKIVDTSKYILVPKGRDHDGCVSAFVKAFSVPVPTFEGRTLAVNDGGRRFIKVRSSDIPTLMENGHGDIGLAYSDVCEERITQDSPLAYEVIGGAHQTFCLLLSQANVDALTKRLNSFSMPPLKVITTYPTIFEKCLKRLREKGTPLNMELSPVVVGGGVEVMVTLGVADIAGDVVNTGETAQANHLVPVPLMDISPVLIYRKTPTA